MNKIPKCRSKYFIPQANNIKPAPKDSNREHLVPKITQKNLKFSANRQLMSNNNIYIKKHSSASQVSQKTQKLKISINDKKLRENKSGSMLNKKCDVTSSEYYYKNNNIKKEYVPQAGSSKLHSSISFGVNNNVRPLSSINNSISVRLSNPKTTKIHNNINSRGININVNNNYGNPSINNNKIEITHSNLDLM